jgi:hypothetical protein
MKAARGHYKKRFMISLKKWKQTNTYEVGPKNKKGGDMWACGRE